VQPLWRSVRAKILAGRGEATEAERLARESVALADRTDAPNLRARVRMDLAEVLLHSKRRAEAAAELDEAVRLFEEKGNTAAAGRARAAAVQGVPA